MKSALHDLLRRDRLRGPWFLLVLAGGGLALLATTADRGDEQRGVGGRATGRDTAEPPSMRRARPDRPARNGTGGVEELVAEWLSAAASAHRAPVDTAGIFVSSRSSPERAAAFRKLLEGVRHDNAGELHERLDACPPDAPEALGDEEWAAFLDRWGRLDGPGAVEMLAASEPLVSRIPGIVGGWAAADPDAAESWLRGLPEHPWKPAAVAAFAESTVRWEPERALAWALSLDGPWRKRALHLVGSQWPADAPEEASAALSEAGFPAGRTDHGEVTGYDLLRPPGPPDPDAWEALSPGVHIAK